MRIQVVSLSGGFDAISKVTFFLWVTELLTGTTLIPTAEPNNNVFGFYPATNFLWWLWCI